MSKNVMGLITMCRRAGKLSLGLDMAKEACKNGSACGCVAASDLSPKSLKELKFVCSKYDTPLYALGLTMDEVWTELGKRAGIMAVNDKGFWKALTKSLTPIEIDENEFYSIDR
ncbi:MAG: 50S ribosomal protein L7 [Ruminococcus sp.]|nr:50S ribosomal protein L7 [Ruminococcus sp.]